MIGAIVLAAGESRRMGTQKLLLPYGGKTVIAHVVDAVLASNVERMVVVTGHDHDAVHQVLNDRPVIFARNEHYRDGMLSSVRRGIAEMGEGTTAFLVVLGDQPNTPSATINTLLDVFAFSHECIVVPSFGGKPGHPIVVAARFGDAILTKYDGVGLRGLLHDYSGCVVYSPVDTNAILFDMDTGADYTHALAQLKKKRLDKD